jgi:murein DD-endopeptidase MepM/ murein hydrolase activator NlpD
VRGAVSKPRRFKIRAPFPCGVQFRVSCGYGRRCSPAHKRVRSQHSTNDYYALDLVRAEPGAGFRKPVVAVADGIVRKAGWARRGWAPYGKLVYIDHDFRDRRGYRYQSLYAHLRSVTVRRGQRVRAGTVIGTLGGSSRGRYLRYGAHLHFAMYRGAKRSMGGGRALVPEPMGNFEDLRRGMVLKACGRPDERIVMRVPPPEQELARGGLLWTDPRPRPVVLRLP